jgi:hypothetical protein
VIDPPASVTMRDPGAWSYAPVLVKKLTLKMKIHPRQKVLIYRSLNEL